RAVASELAIDAEYLQESVFEPFVLGCIDRAQGSGLVVSGFKGVYSDVLQAWDDDARLAKALLNVCDYHCSNISDNRRGRYAEFTKPPFDLLPCELMLVNRLRKDTGRAPLEFSHPLTDTLGPIPGDASPQSHPVLGELRAAWERFWS
ncbi:MAG: hypothetical protein KDB32_06540, partial [Planctomycetes bacterium]|nr:hypothetical protein [Planctomycetota bacterium]